MKSEIVKKLLLIVACMMAVIQHVGAQEYFSSASDYARLYVGAIEPQYQISLWHNIPYYGDNTKMYKGRISYYGVVYDDVQLRFDQLKQRVVVLSPVGSVFCLPEQDYIDWFEMDGHRYVHDPEDSTRFASLLCDGSANGIRLYHSVWKVYSGENYFGEKKSQKVLSTNEHYTLITPDGEKYHVKRASDVMKLFPEQKKQIKQFAKQNHLSFSKSERERSLSKVIGSVKGSPVPESATVPTFATNVAGSSQVLSTTSATLIDDKMLMAGIPVLDSDTLSMAGSDKTKVYVVPGVKKARASICSPDTCPLHI